MYVYRCMHVCDRYCDIDTCIMYMKCVLFNNLINIQMYCMCTMYPSSSQRSLWSLQLLTWTLWCQQYRFLWVPYLCRHIWRLPGILCLLAWLFSLMFAVSHTRMCVLPLHCWLRHLVTCGQAPALIPSFYLCPVPSVSDTTDAWPTWAVVPSYWHSKYLCTQRREPLHPGRVWNGASWEDRTDCAEVQDRTRQTYNQQLTYKPPIPVVIFSFLIFGSSLKHPITSLVQLQMHFSDWNTRLMVLLWQSSVCIDELCTI